MGINQDLITKVTENQTKQDTPEFRTGDTIKVHIKIKEGSKERIQIFEGVVIKRSGAGNDATFTVRKESFGIGVEKTFHVNSPVVAKIEVLKEGSVRKSRIFYMRDRKGKSARIKPRVKGQAETPVATKEVKETPKQEEVKAEAAPEKGTQEMTKAELLDKARDEGADVKTSMKKDEVKEAIYENREEK